MVVASVTHSITSFVGDHSLYAVFSLMVVAAVVPVGSELVMLYAGALAGGAFASHVVLFGDPVTTPFWAYVCVVLAGLLGNFAGALAGWFVGAFGGRPFILRNARLLHVSEAKLDRAERWLESRGAWTVAAGFALPVLRSFVALPAGVVRLRLGPYLVAAAAGIAAFCFAFAGIGWGVGRSYERFQHDFRYVEIAIGVLLLAGIVYLIWKRRATRLARRAADSSL